MEPRNRKKRQLVRESPPTTYRLQFYCEHVGRYLSCTKRRIKWIFGFTNLHAAGEGKFGDECRGEEHEVELVWSLHSEKVRIFWNKRNISHLFRDTQDAGKVDLSWESRSGERFRILAHESSSSTRSTRQYDFFVDGVSFFSFPRLSQLTPKAIEVDQSMSCEETPTTAVVIQPAASCEETPITVVVVHPAASFEELSESSADSICTSDYLLFGHNDENREFPDAGFRLSMAGFIPCVPLDEVVDDLTSSYSYTNNILESLKRAVTGLIQDSEDMVSMSIINALSEDNSNTCFPSCRTSSRGSSPASIGSTLQISTEIEANILHETIQWANLNVLCAPRPDVQEQKRLFLQNQMLTIFIHARHERLTEDDALRILLDIATLLDIPICSSIQTERDTLIIRDAKKEIYVDTLTTTMAQFEELRKVGVSSNRSFAFCRFSSERGPLRAFAATDQGALVINGKPPQLSLIQKPLVSGRPRILGRRSISSGEVQGQVPKPIFARQKSHQRNLIPIDTRIVESPIFHRLINDAALVSPIDVAPFEQEDSFGKIYDTKDFHHSNDALATISTTRSGSYDLSNSPRYSYP